MSLLISLSLTQNQGKDFRKQSYPKSFFEEWLERVIKQHPS